MLYRSSILICIDTLDRGNLLFTKKDAFSAIALDHAHEQVGVSGVVGLKENPGAFKRWMVAGPEVARMIEEFERSLSSINSEANAYHEQVLGV